jgi:hypothetical protein
MSYIRCLSNPEGMYIYGTRLPNSKKIVVHISGAPCDPETDPMVPHNDFKKACKAYEVYQKDEFTSGDFGYKEIVINEPTDELWTNGHEQEQKKFDALLTKDIKRWRKGYKAFRQKIHRSYRIGIYWKGELRYKLWRVTWAYIARGGAER